MGIFTNAEVAMTARTSFGQWLKQRRKALDITQDDLAGRIGCSPSNLYKIEADERRPSKQIAALLAECLNIPPDERAAFVRFARAEEVEDTVPWGTPFHSPTNLPAQPTLLIGRDEDVTAISKRLLRDETRLLTLIGPPGIGKTRLALQVAAQALDDFADGVFLIALAPISDANLVATTIANTLGVADIGPRTPLERLQAFLRDKQVLLVLDNFEQILAAAAQIAELLAVCPLLKILVTSRAPLRIRQERQIPVSPLAIPDLAHLPDVESVIQYAAVTLFMERAQAVKPDFTLTQENAPTIAAICTRLDGLPLAIELISARVKLLSLSALLERLHGRLMLQSDGLRDIEARHRTLNAAIDWSYQLLSAEEQTLFRRLGIFVGGWTLEAAEAVCMENVNLNLLDGLASLLDKNLVKQEARIDGEPRFLMLETIREYAHEQLVVSGELDELCQRHTNYFLKLAEAAEAHAFGREQIAWFDRLEGELDNLRVTLAWSLETETSLRLVAALGWFFTERSHWNEGFDWLERTLAANSDAPSFLLAKGLHTAGRLAWFVGNIPRAQAHFEQSLALARETNDRWNIAWALSHLGNFVYQYSDFAYRAAFQDESLALFRELDDAMGIAHVLVRRAYPAFVHKDYAHTRALLEEAQIRAFQAGDKGIIATITFIMGWLAWHQDRDLIQAKMLIERGLTLYREVRYQAGVNNALIWLGWLELALGNMTEAQTRNQEVLTSFRDIAVGHPYLPDVLVTLANIANANDQFERAVRLLGAANSIGEIKARDKIDYDNVIAAVRTQLGQTAFAEAWAVGSAMTPEQVVAYALAE
jgi:predicted ATPase/DNA-binding XRE family transcriptional regulator